MKKYLFILALLIAMPVSAMTLYDYYGGHLPSVSDRAPTYNKYFSDEYHGTAEQNTKLVDALTSSASQSVSNSTSGNNLLLGAALPEGVAVFQTSLLSAITANATSMTLVANAVRGGSALSGFQCFTVDEGSSIAEYICGTVSGTAVTSLTRGVDPVTATTTNSTLKFAHRRGAEVKITDFPVLQILKHQANGEDTYPHILTYTGGTACSVSSPNNAICDKAYTDGVVVSGASNANTTTKGIVEIATPLEIASSTSLGGTGAIVVIPASSATSTPGNSTTLNVVVTQNNGKIAQGFLDLTQQFTFTKTIVSGVNSPAYVGANIDIDWSLGQTAVINLTQNSTFTFSNVTTGTTIRAIICQDGTGSRLITAYPASMRWQTGFAPTLTTTANKCDIMSFITGTSTASVFGATSANF